MLCRLQYSSRTFRPIINHRNIRIMSSSSSSHTTVTLNDGSVMPSIGFGLGTAHYGKDCTNHLLDALENGYTYIDAAQMYANSASIGDALKQWKGKREDLFILTKVGVQGKDAKENDPKVALEAELAAMNTSYVDCYLLHFPKFAAPYSLGEYWKKMEDIKASGLAKSIGVSNFHAEHIAELSKSWTVPPVVNQIEYQVYNYHAKNMLRLRDEMDKHDIKIQAYGPLASITKAPGGPVDSVVKEIATKHGYTESQVLLAWAKQYGGGCVVTTSRQRARQLEQLESITKNSPLSQDELNAIAEAGKGKFARFFGGDFVDEVQV